jgi:hypothetical protein
MDALDFDLISGKTFAFVSQVKKNSNGIVKTHPSSSPSDLVHGQIALVQIPGSHKILGLLPSKAKLYHKIVWIPKPTARQRRNQAIIHSKTSLTKPYRT